MTIQAAIDARSTFPAILRELLEKQGEYWQMWQDQLTSIAGEEGVG